MKPPTYEKATDPAPACPRVRRPRLLLLTATLLLTTTRLASGADGDLDTSFSGDGIYDEEWGYFSAIDAVAGLGDGSMLLGGWMSIGPFSPREVALLKLRPNGTRDGGFATAGRFHMEVAIEGTSIAYLLGVHPLPDGKILLSVAASGPELRDTLVLVRLEATGVPDLTFGPGGAKIVDEFPLGGGAFAKYREAVETPDGDLLAIGECHSCGGFGHVVATRLDPDGDIDRDFGDDGWVVFSAEPGVEHQSLTAAVDAAGRLVIAGNTGDGGGLHEMFVARLTGSGGFDAAFGDGGLAFLDYPDYAWPEALAIDPVSQRILIASGSDPFEENKTSGVVALSDLGNLYISFGFLGITSTTLEEGTLLHALGLQSDGKIVAAGWIDHTGSEPGGVYLVRLLANGSFDDSFHGNGVVRHELALGYSDRGRALAVVGGRLVVGGNFALTDDIDLAALRTRSRLIFTDGLERGTALGWQ